MSFTNYMYIYKTATDYKSVAYFLINVYINWVFEFWNYGIIRRLCK